MESGELMVSGRFFDAVSIGFAESVTVRVTVPLKPAVGVPLIWPPDDIVSVDGKPVADHEYGVVPPVALAVNAYATFAVPVAKALVVIASGCTIVICKFPVALICGFVESFTVMVAVLLPAIVGVPLMTPVVALMVKPAGNPVADQLYGVVPPVALTVAL